MTNRPPKVFRNCTMENFGDQGSWEYPCQVRIGDGTIAVSFRFEPGTELFVYEGREIELGHFKLTCDKLNSRCELHRFTHDDVLHGSWVEQGEQSMEQGMWRITLDE